MRFSTDIGGTFTDLVVEDDSNGWRIYKTPTNPGDPIQGLLNVLLIAAADRQCSLADFLANGDTLIHGTTHALNALVTGKTAKTAFVTTEGHPDILLLREGGRTEPFNHSQPYPRPYVPRSLTFEISERVMSDGSVLRALDESSVSAAIRELERLDIESVAVCLLWSVANPAHELRIGELLRRDLPGVPFTLSHQLNPVLREYRRASATAIDASLKPLMSEYLCGLERRVRGAGFHGRILILTSQGGVLDINDVASAPIHLLNSGPSMAPVAGRFHGQLEAGASDVIVADAGGTTYDVSLVRDGRIPLTRETWIGRPFLGHMTGFPSVDVKSIGAGGGSVAWVDAGGALHLGPQSMGANPGPACYGLGGVNPTLTDAAVVLGYLDPGNFLGGTIKLDAAAARQAIESKIAGSLGLGVNESAWAILSVATENMAQAILDITVNQGIDPKRAVLIGGGGAAGLNSIWIARRLGCEKVVLPECGAALSAAGALMSDLRSEYRRCTFLSTANFDAQAANETLATLRRDCAAFLEGLAGGSREKWIEYSIEARYRNQVWEIQVPLRSGEFSSLDDLERLTADFHEMHERIFGVRDDASPVEIVNWSATACCRLREPGHATMRAWNIGDASPRTRMAYFDGSGITMTPIYRMNALEPGIEFRGPAIIESPFTAIVVDGDATFQRTPHSSLTICPCGAAR
jgi:N-methylhydantoinase A